MAVNDLHTMTIAEVEAIVDQLPILRKVEVIPTEEAVGRFLACPYFAKRSTPGELVSAMDGFALPSQWTKGARPESPVRLVENMGFPVDTGEPIPEQANTVVRIEDLRQTSGGSLEVLVESAPGQNIRQVGEDIAQGELILPAYHQVRPVDIGALLAGGITEVQVVQRPVVRIIPTGNELMEPGEELKPGAVLEYNSRMVAALVREWGGLAVREKKIEDDIQPIKEGIQKAAATADLIVLIAGTSAGREDFSAKTIALSGKLLVHGVAVKPGKPLILGLVGDTPIIGLPGYPVTAVLHTELFIRRLMENYFHQSHVRPILRAMVRRQIKSPGGADEFIRVKLGIVDEVLVAYPLSRSSGTAAYLTKADGVVRVPQGVKDVAADTEVEVYASTHNAAHQILLAGSADPVLDLLVNMLKWQHSDYELFTAHVESMAALKSLQIREVHLAGVSVVDGESGEYNLPDLRKLFKGQEVLAVNLARTEVGFLTLPGNPLGITGILDLLRPNLVCLREMPGANRRTLLELLAEKAGIDFTAVQFYHCEVKNQHSTAALIKERKADFGLGTKWLAAELGLDFISLTKESYDLILLSRELTNPAVAKLLAVLKSGEFRQAIAGLKGYHAESTGQVVYQGKVDSPWKKN